MIAYKHFNELDSLSQIHVTSLQIKATRSEADLVDYVKNEFKKYNFNINEMSFGWHSLDNITLYGTFNIKDFVKYYPLVLKQIIEQNKGIDNVFLDREIEFNVDDSFSDVELVLSDLLSPKVRIGFEGIVVGKHYLLDGLVYKEEIDRKWIEKALPIIEEIFSIYNIPKSKANKVINFCKKSIESTDKIIEIPETISDIMKDIDDIITNKFEEAEETLVDKLSDYLVTIFRRVSKKKLMKEVEKLENKALKELERKRIKVEVDKRKKVTKILAIEDNTDSLQDNERPFADLSDDMQDMAIDFYFTHNKKHPEWLKPFLRDLSKTYKEKGFEFKTTQIRLGKNKDDIFMKGILDLRIIEGSKLLSDVINITKDFWSEPKIAVTIPNTGNVKVGPVTSIMSEFFFKGGISLNQRVPGASEMTLTYFNPDAPDVEITKDLLEKVIDHLQDIKRFYTSTKLDSIITQLEEQLDMFEFMLTEKTKIMLPELFSEMQSLNADLNSFLNSAANKEVKPLVVKKVKSFYRSIRTEVYKFLKKAMKDIVFIFDDDNNIIGVI